MNKWDKYRAECDLQTRMDNALELAKKLVIEVIDINQSIQPKGDHINFAKMVNILGAESAGAMKCM